MRFAFVLIGIGAGLASALLFYSAARGSATVGTILVLLTPLPSLLAGLSWGWLTAALAAVVGALVMSSAASVPFGAGYFLALGAPVALSTYFAYLSRPHAHDAAKREWYPPGRLLAGVALYGGVLPLLVLPLIGGTYDILREPMGKFLRALSDRAAPDLGVAPLTDPQLNALTELFVFTFPALVAAYWVVVFAVNLYLAGRIVKASGWLAREWPDLSLLAYPHWLVLVLLAALLATTQSGVLGVAGSGLTGALVLAYVFAGLAVMHCIARGRAPWLLWTVYAAVLLVEPYTAIVLALAGLAEPVLKLKQRFGVSSPPPTST